MFFRLSTTDAPPQSSPHPAPLSHPSTQKSAITFAGAAKMFLKLRRLANRASEDNNNEHSCCMLDSPATTDVPSAPSSSQPTHFHSTPPSPPTPAPCQSSYINSPASPTAPAAILATPSSSSSSSSSSPRSPKHKPHHIQYSSGEIPLSHPGIAENACKRREPIERTDTYICTGGVNLPVLLRTTRTDLMDTVSILGANALVQEQWKCTIYGPRSRNKLEYKVQIHYKARATRSTLMDPHQPVAMDSTNSIPGLMTVLRRNDY